MKKIAVVVGLSAGLVWLIGSGCGTGEQVAAPSAVAVVLADGGQGQLPITAGPSVAVSDGVVSFSCWLKDARGTPASYVTSGGGKVAPGIEVVDAGGKVIYQATLAFG